MLISFQVIPKTVGTSRDSRDMASLLGLRCPDFFKPSRDSRDKLSNPVPCHVNARMKTVAKRQAGAKPMAARPAR